MLNAAVQPEVTSASGPRSRVPSSLQSPPGDRDRLYRWLTKSTRTLQLIDTAPSVRHVLNKSLCHVMGDPCEVELQP
jgi:hypothetical protein